MRNPFSAIGSAIAKAGQAIGGAVGKAIGGTGKALSKAGGALTKTGEKMSTPKAPKTQAPKAPPVAPPKAPAAPPKAPPAGKAPAAPPKAPEPTKLPPAPPPEGKRAPKLPPTDFGPGTGGGPRSGISRDERVLGIDSDAERDLREAIKEFEADHRISSFGEKARGFIDHPNFSTIFDKYSTGSGWSSNQWFKGANNIHDIRITPKGGGKILIEFDADFIIDGDVGGSGDIGGRTVSAVF